MPYRAFSVKPVDHFGNANGLSFTAQIDFKSLLIRDRIFKQLDFLWHADRVRIRMVATMRAQPSASAYADLLYEVFAVKVLATAGKALRNRLVRMESDGTNKPSTFSLWDGLQDKIMTPNPFEQQRELGSAPLSRTKSGVKLEFGEGPLTGRFWMPEASDNSLFDVFFIEFDAPAEAIDVWVLQMALSREHDGSRQGYELVRSISDSALEALGTTKDMTRSRRK